MHLIPGQKPNWIKSTLFTATSSADNASLSATGASSTALLSSPAIAFSSLSSSPLASDA
jgi:hypothetical protein